MSQEIFVPYTDRTATVVGGRGALGRRIVKNLQSLEFKEVRICEKGDPFVDFINQSTDLFFAVDNVEIESMLQASRDFLQPQHTILDGSSIKKPLITLYRSLDEQKISVCSTHLGAVPSQPWRGVKVWACEVGPNSERAKRLAYDIFLSTNSSIQTIKIEDHENVERDQWYTMALMHIFANALINSGYPLEQFHTFATLNAELLSLPLGRTLGQGSGVPTEVLFNQPNKQEFFVTLSNSLKQFGRILEDREKLQQFITDNITFHDNPSGFVETIFRKAGIVGARNANLRMYHFSFRITKDKPGILRELLEPFYEEGANLTAIDSIPGIISADDEQITTDHEMVVDFDIGIDPKTINPDKEERIKKRLGELGCTIITRQSI